MERFGSSSCTFCIMMRRSLVPYSVMFFLRSDFPEPVGHKSAPILLFSVHELPPLLMLLPEKQLHLLFLLLYHISENFLPSLSGFRGAFHSPSTSRFDRSRQRRKQGDRERQEPGDEEHAVQRRSFRLLDPCGHDLVWPPPPHRIS